MFPDLLADCFGSVLLDHLRIMLRSAVDVDPISNAAGLAVRLTR